MKSVLLILSACILLGLTQMGCKSSSDNANANGGSETSKTPPAIPPGGDASSYFNMGLDAYKNDNDEEAVALFKESIRLDPTLAEAHYRLGLAQSALGLDTESETSFEEAVKAYREQLKAHPDDGSLLYMLGLAYAKLGRYEDAVRSLKESIKIAPDDDDKYYELGLAHSKLAQYREAVAAFNKALELNPDNFPATDALEKARAGLERRKAFIEQAERMRKEKEKLANMNANLSVSTNSATPAP